MSLLHPLTLFFFLSGAFLARSQQPYATEIADCTNQHNSTGLLGYFCGNTGLTDSNQSCQSFLTFHADPPYTNVTSISALLGSDPTNLAQANSVQTNTTFAPNTKILVPVNCSCAGPYFQYNTTYLVNAGSTLLIIANNTYQGLSTCQALQYQNLGNSSPQTLFVGQNITVPLRCACPSSNQTRNGVKYLVSYLVDWFDTMSSIAERFGVEVEGIAAANELASDVVYPFTTLLIPVKAQPNVSQLLSPPPPPPPPPPPTNASVQSRKSANHAGIYIGIGVSVAVLVLIASVVAVLVRKARKRRASATLASDGFAGTNKKDGKTSGVTGEASVSIDDIFSSISDIGSSLKVYTYTELRMATEDFSAERRIGGSVYRAVFNGDSAAVRVMDRDVSTEVEIMKKTNHFNLIRLIGLCFNQGYWYLVFEYAENGQLHDWIFAKSGSMALNWSQRVQIALDVAEGLSYLHGYTQPPYVHMDISSSSILLDASFHAKIRNFSNVRLIKGREGEFTMTSHIAGTQGYMAPEYLEHGLVSPKVDVYAFGVVLMELVTGKDIAELEGGNRAPFADLNALIGENDDARWKLEEFVDPSMEGSCHLDSVVMMVKLIERCVRRDAARRPSMGEVAQYLLKLSDISVLSLQSSSEYRSSGSDKGLLEKSE